MSDSSENSERSETIRQWLDVLTLVAGLAAFGFCIFVLAGPVLWRTERLLRPLLRQYGIQLSDPYALALLYLREALFLTAAGLVVGRIGWRHWRHFAVVFAVGFLMIPITILAPKCSGRIDSRELSRWTLMVTIPLPSTLPGAWCGSRPHRRRVLERERQGKCVKCAYDLTGIVSGVCPECGAKCPNVQKSKSPNNEAISH